MKTERPFLKIANIADLATDARGHTEIIKFHGNFDDDESLVLTESSYFQRMSMRQTQRLLSRYRDGGGGALIHRSRGRPAVNRLGAGVQEYVLGLVR